MNWSGPVDRLILKLPVFWTGSKFFFMSNLQFGQVMGKNFVKNQLRVKAPMNCTLLS